MYALLGGFCARHPATLFVPFFLQDTAYLRADKAEKPKLQGHAHRRYRSGYLPASKAAEMTGIPQTANEIQVLCEADKITISFLGQACARERNSGMLLLMGFLCAQDLDFVRTRKPI